MEPILIILTLLSGSSVALNWGVHYKLGKIETIIGMCPVCQHHTDKKITPEI